MKNFSLSLKISLIFLISFIILNVFIVCVNFYRAHHREQDKVDKSFKHILESDSKLLIEQLWLIRYHEIDLLLKGLLNIPNLTYIEISNNQKVISQFGTKSDESIKKSKDLFYYYNHKNVFLGTLYIEYSKQQISKNIVRVTLYEYFIAMSQFIIFIIILYILVYYFIIRHIFRLNRFINSFTLSNIDSGKRLQKKRNFIFNQADEIDALRNSINDMIQKIIHNITERKKTEVALQKALDEKNVLLRELLHRTKNNMQVIKSMLTLRRKFSKNPEVIKHFLDAENKILSMSLVHKKLYQSKDLSNINLKEYIDELVNLIAHSYVIDTHKITFIKEIEDMLILIDVVIPIGLIINELLSNIFKYAFPENEGTVVIKIFSTNNIINIHISDNGVGVPHDFNFFTTQTLGLQTVISLVKNQLSGNIDFKSDNGLSCDIDFENILYKERI